MLACRLQHDHPPTTGSSGSFSPCRRLAEKRWRAISDCDRCLSSCGACRAAGDGGGDGANVSGVDEWEEAAASCKEETSRAPLKMNIMKTKNSCGGTRGCSKHRTSGN